MSQRELTRVTRPILTDQLDGRAVLVARIRDRYLTERRDATDTTVASRTEVAQRLRLMVNDYEPLLGAREIERLVEEITAEIAGLGPLEPYLADPSISEIMVNRPDVVWIESDGRMRSVECRISDEQIERCIQRIIAPLGLRIDRNAPYVDARLVDGSRIHAVIPPLAVDGPSFTIRKFSSQEVPLVRFTDAATARFLQDAVHRRQTILISGATGSGKTTLLGALSTFIGDGERVVTIEETAELRLSNANLVRLEARLPTVEGRGEVTVRTLVRNALRMRPDRIIVGEVRGAEAFDMLQAMGTGHEGSLCTLHANSASDALSRVVSLTLLAGVGLPVTAIEGQVARSVDLVVHVQRRAGQRRIVEVARVVNDRAGIRAEPVRIPAFEGTCE